MYAVASGFQVARAGRGRKPSLRELLGQVAPCRSARTRREFQLPPSPQFSATMGRGRPFTSRSGGAATKRRTKGKGKGKDKSRKTRSKAAAEEAGGDKRKEIEEAAPRR